MFQFVLDEAIKTGCFNKVHISTESKSTLLKLNKLKKQKKKYQKFMDLSFLRPKEMANDKFPMEKVVNFIKKRFKKFDYNHFAMLYATAVNLKKKDLTQFVNYYFKICKKYPNIGITCQTLTAYPAPVEWSLTLKKTGEIKYDNFLAHKKTSDTYKKKFFDSGGIQIFNSKYFTSKKIKRFGFILPYYKCVDIDFEDDYILAKKLI